MGIFFVNGRHWKFLRAGLSHLKTVYWFGALLGGNVGACLAFVSL